MKIGFLAVSTKLQSVTFLAGVTKQLDNKEHLIRKQNTFSRGFVDINPLLK